MRKQNKFDETMKEIIQEEINSIDVPDLQDVWNNIDENINKKDNVKTAFLNKKIASVIASLLIIGVIYSTTDEGHASYRKFLSFITNTIENTIDIGLKQNTKPNPDIDEGWELVTENLSVEEAVQQATFDIRIPTYMPTGYSLSEIVLMQFGGETLNAELLYISEYSELIKLIQEPIIGDYAQTIQADSEKNRISQINKNGIDYNIIEANDGEVIVVWEVHGIKYTTIGFQKEEILNLIFSIK